MRDATVRIFSIASVAIWEHKHTSELQWRDRERERERDRQTERQRYFENEKLESSLTLML